jgi:hypothetical protein
MRAQKLQVLPTVLHQVRGNHDGTSVAIFDYDDGEMAAE